MMLNARGCMRQLVLLVAVTALLCSTTVVEAGGEPGKPGKKPRTSYQLTILHNNDGESELLPATIPADGGDDFGGIAHFTTLVWQLKFDAIFDGPFSFFFGPRKGVVLLSSGDNFLAGPELNASFEAGFFYDAIALDLLDYDAFAIGNHEFDFGPDVLADFISEVDGGFLRAPAPFVSANLDVSAEPELAALAARRRIVSSTVVREAGERIGIVGATTDELATISSPRDVVISEVAPAVQAEIDRLTRAGVNKIILISHLQSINEDLELVPMLRGVDVAIAGGGDEVLANPDDLLVPGDEEEIFGSYPLTATGADGATVPVVTTRGSYRYVGRLIVDFDKKGRVIGIDEKSGPVRVASGNQDDAVPPAFLVQFLVVDPVAASIEALADTVLAASEVDLDGRRSQVRTVETNYGNLIADAMLMQAAELASDFGAPVPDVALQNGGGIRNDSVVPAGAVTELDTFDALPFSNFVSIVADVPREQFKEILENAVSRVEDTSGRFAQVAGFGFEWDRAGTPQELDADGNVVTVGTRVVNVTLEDGTPIVVDGVVQAGPGINIATIDFLARGGDQYPFRGAPFTVLGVSYQQALANYLEFLGVVTAVDYPVGGEGRILETVVE